MARIATVGERESRVRGPPTQPLEPPCPPLLDGVVSSRTEEAKGADYSETLYIAARVVVRKWKRVWVSMGIMSEGGCLLDLPGVDAIAHGGTHPSRVMEQQSDRASR